MKPLPWLAQIPRRWPPRIVGGRPVERDPSVVEPQPVVPQPPAVPVAAPVGRAA